MSYSRRVLSVSLRGNLALRRKEAAFALTATLAVPLLSRGSLLVSPDRRDNFSENQCAVTMTDSARLVVVPITSVLLLMLTMDKESVTVNYATTKRMKLLFLP